MEWSGLNRTIALLLILGAASCGGESPPPSTSDPAGGGERISGTERLGWSQAASNTSELATFRFAAYVDGNRAELGDVSCGGASAPFACSSRMPQMAAGSHSLELVTFVVENGTVVESGRSAALRVTVTGATASGPGPAPAPALPLSTRLLATSDGAELRADVIADQLTAPTSLASSPDGRVFVAERDGRIRIIRGGALEAQPAVTIYEALATAAGDGGLAGIALDREFEQTHFLYAVYTVSGPEATRVFRVVRYREVDGRLGERIVILDGVAAGAKPAAAIDIGPDGNLYLAFDAGQGTGRVPSASYSGKVLRLSPDGTTPKDQAGGPVLATDFVSPRGLDWNPETGTLWVVDAKTRDAEELRIVGARGSSSTPSRARLLLPAGMGASALAFYRGTLVPAFAGNVFVAAGEGQYLLRLRVDARDPSKVTFNERLLSDLGSHIRAVTTANDGMVYVATERSVLRVGPR
jgi:glucose/arabinose dehydrogenase